MAKKDNDNFDFETETESNGKIDLVGFFKNLTKQQKGIILAAVVGVVLVVAIVIACIIIGANNNSNNGETNSGNGGTSQGGSDGGDGSHGGNMPDEILDFQVSSPPHKTVYYVGEELNCDGMNLYFRNSDDKSEYIYYADDPDAFVITGFDSSVPMKNQVITVSTRGFSATFSVAIIEVPLVPPILESIYLDPKPQTTYTLEDAFRFNNAKIVAVYSDGTTKTEYLAMNHIDGFGAIDSVGEHEIIIRYFDDNGGYAETTLTITITE